MTRGALEHSRRTRFESTNLVRFGPFELDLSSPKLKRGTSCVRLQAQPFAILQMLLERPGEAVTRAELRDRLWPSGTFVDFEHSLNAAIKRLRAALGDNADDPRYIQTLPRRGYRLVDLPDETAGPGVGSDSVRLAVLPFIDLGEMWMNTYDRTMGDCLAVQADVASEIARSLAVEFNREPPELPGDSHSPMNL
jgi:DNA-binding winged helix-turn-helix (wHTH) protein